MTFKKHDPNNYIFYGKLQPEKCIEIILNLK